jgi:predicted MFS family arabinose efflux permease
VQLSFSSLYNVVNRNHQEKIFNQFILAHATGMTFGPTFGICLYSVIGWRWEFVTLAFCVFLLLMYSLQPAFKFSSSQKNSASSKYILKKIRLLMLSSKGKGNYSFVFLTGIFHSGLFVWLSTFISVYCKFANQTTGIALLIFGLPGLLMAANIAIASQTYGRIKIILTGLLLVATSLSILLLQTSFYTAMFAIAILSVGYVMTQPFYIGLINTIRNQSAKSLAISLGFGLLFIGYGTGPIIFNFLNTISFSLSTIAIATLSLMLALLSYQSSPKKIIISAGDKLTDKAANF